MTMPSAGGETDSAYCTAQQKAARALHRTAPDTTADCAVPPLHHQSTRRQMVASKRNNIGIWASLDRHLAQAMASGECAR
jgi:hypothetical protein